MKKVYTGGVNTDKVHYVFSEIQPIFEKRISDGRIRSYVYAGLIPIARVDGVIGDENSRKYWYHTDHVGSVKAVTNSTGAVVWKADYLPFGTQYTKNKIDPNFEEDELGFTGKGFDKDVGLYYFNARWYDAETGRFISEDPVADPNNPNLYSYVRNNPLRFIDPTGLEATLGDIGIANPGGINYNPSLPVGGAIPGNVNPGSGGGGPGNGGTPGSTGSGNGTNSKTENTNGTDNNNAIIIEITWELDFVVKERYNPGLERNEIYFEPVYVPKVNMRPATPADSITVGPSTPEGPNPGGGPASDSENSEVANVTPPDDNNEQKKDNINWGLVITGATAAGQKSLEEAAKKINPRYYTYDSIICIYTSPIAKILKGTATGVGVVTLGINEYSIATDPGITLNQKILKGVIEAAAFTAELGVGLIIGSIASPSGPGAIAAGILAATVVAIGIDATKNSLYNQLGF